MIDLNRRLGFPGTADPGLAPARRIVILRVQGESIGMLVDAVGDVIDVSAGDLAPPPGNIQGIQGRCFNSVVRHEQGLIGILDVTRVLS